MKKLIFTLTVILTLIPVSGATFISPTSQISKQSNALTDLASANPNAVLHFSKSFFPPQVSYPLPENFSLKCPLTACIVLKAFQTGKQKWNPGHRGVDLNTEKGKIVFAPADGEIIYAGILVDRSVISIKHKNDFRSTFEPVIPLVQVGDTVKTGDKIGIVTDHHCNTKQCLHWGFKSGSDGYLNPLDFLQRKHIRLLS